MGGGLFIKKRKICVNVDESFFQEIHRVAAQRMEWERGYVQNSINYALMTYTELVKNYLHNKEIMDPFLIEEYPDLPEFERNIAFILDAIYDYAKRKGLKLERL